MTVQFPLPYREGPGGVARPYLTVVVTGPNGHAEKVFGLIDSGADCSSLPLGFAGLFGYTHEDLVPATVTQVSGEVSVLQAAKPAKAHIAGLPELEFELRPWFAEGNTALWGRADFMMAFGVAFDQPAKQFTLFRAA